MNKLRNFKIIFFVLPCLIILGCSSTLPKPSSKDERIKCYISEFDDITGSYAVVEPKFEEMLHRELKKDYSERYDKNQTPSLSRTIFLTNMFKPLPYKNTENVTSDSSSEGTINYLLIEGTVEQVSYGSVNEIKNYVINMWLFGLWGLILSDPMDTSKRAGFVEYKISLYEMPEKKFIDSFILQGLHIDDPDRKLIIYYANKLAAQQLAFKLNSEIANIFNKKPKRHSVRGEKTIVQSSLHN